MNAKLNVSLLPPLPTYIIVARNAHASVALSNGSVWVLGGRESSTSFKNDVWKSVNGGSSWILVTSSAGWGGNGFIMILWHI